MHSRVFMPYGGDNGIQARSTNNHRDLWSRLKFRPNHRVPGTSEISVVVFRMSDVSVFLLTLVDFLL
jgi:hypothetical protein